MGVGGSRPGAAGGNASAGVPPQDTWDEPSPDDWADPAIRAAVTGLVPWRSPCADPAECYARLRAVLYTARGPDWAEGLAVALPHLAGLRCLDLRGVNVSAPMKQEAEGRAGGGGGEVCVVTALVQLGTTLPALRLLGPLPRCDL
jgi:hypothetical protein